ncbi:MAG: gluconate kinase, partial [Halomonas sp.]
RGLPLVVACSALKRRYRDILRGGDPSLAILFLDGNRERLRERLQARPDHFFRGDAMLESQLADLEPPGADEAVTLSIELSPGALVERFLAGR